MENVKEFAEYATQQEDPREVKLTCAQYARRVPQGGHSLLEPLHQYDRLHFDLYAPN